MKKVSKSAFICLLLSIIVNVNALNVGDQFVLSPGVAQNHSASYGLNESYQLHTVTGGGKTYDAYCMDRGKAAGSGALYVVNRMMPKLKGDLAVLYVLNNGADKEQIHLAIRLLVSKGMLNWSHTGTAEYLAKIDSAVNCMKSDSTFSSTLTQFLSNSSKKKNDNAEDDDGKGIALLDVKVQQLVNGNKDYSYYICNKCTKYRIDRVAANTPLFSSISLTGITNYLGSKLFTKCGEITDKRVNYCYTSPYSNYIYFDLWDASSRCVGDQYYSKDYVLEDQCSINYADNCSGIPSNICSSYDLCYLDGNSCMDDCTKQSYVTCLDYSNCKLVGNTCMNKSDSVDDGTCNTNQKILDSLDSCLAESARKQEQSYNTKKYTCQQNTLTKCWEVVEDKSGAECDSSKNEYSKDQCDEIKKTYNSGTCEKQSNGCYKYISDSTGGSGTGSGPSGGASINCGGFDGIKQLLIDAMNYANENYGNESSESKVEKGPATEQQKEDGYVKKIVSVKIDINNISDVSSDTEYFKYLGFEVEKENEATEVKLLGASKEFLETEDGWESISEGEDLSKKLDNRKGTIYVGYLLSLQSSDDTEVTNEEVEENCDVKIKFKYEYSNEDGGAVLYAAGNTTGQQRFFIASEGEPIQDIFELDTSLCSEATCDPTITVPTLCEPGEDEKVNEDGLIEYEFREAYNPDTGKYNIKKCLLKKNSNDIAENSYKYKDSENAQMVVDNPYCEVKCKEDYKFGVPYKKTTEAGRYFQISTSIKGEQDCYTTKLDYNKYTEDVVKKQAEIIDKYNEWLLNYENHMKTPEQGLPAECKKCSTNDDGSCNEDLEILDYFDKIVHSNDFYSYVIISSEDGPWSIEVTKGAGRPDEKYGEWTAEKTCTSNGSTCTSSGSCYWEKTPEEDYKDKDENEYKPKIQSTKQELKQLLEELRMIVDEYNSCVADHDYASKQEDKSKTYGESAFWDMVYIYDPEVYYSYDEPEPNNTSISKWIEQVKSISSCDNGTCDIMISPDELIKAEKCSDKCSVDCDELGHSGSVEDIDENMHPVTWYCDGEVDNEYKECDGEEIDNILSVDDYDEEYHWMVLDEDLDTGIEAVVHIGNNLKNSKHLITKMDYLHKIAQSDGNYTTARVYFSGHDNGDIKIENTDQIENYDVVDGLPVSINTPQGVYNYTLTLKNMGTYYSTTPDIGRIFDDEGNTMSNLYIEKGIRPSATKENGEEIKGNEYVCTYEVSANECTDSSGTKHYKTECNLENETWDQCKERLCPNSAGPYCVHDSNGYYVCDNNYYNESCQKQGSREEALAAVGCTLGEPCENNYNCCPDCTVECIGECVVKSECTTTSCSGDSNSKPQYNFKPISPGNMFPTDREIGFNWDISGKYKNSLVARKAKDTREEITARANDVTSESGSSGLPKVEDYSLKVTMDTNMINKIRQYNQEQGTYNNDTMSCYDYQLDYDEEHCKKNGYAFVNNQCIMSNIFCYSEFVDKLLDGDFGGDVDMTNQEGRTKTKEAFNKQYTGITGTLDNVITNDYWTIYSFTSLDTNGDGIPDVGPSWK